MRIIDFFCGIGGVAEAARNLAENDPPATAPLQPSPALAKVVSAIDIDRRITSVYRVNHDVEPRIKTIESINEIPDGDLWWLSPPCQPYTQRGKQHAEQDRRSLGLARMIDLVKKERPKGLMLENVPKFCGSRHDRLLRQTLQQSGYSIRVDELCPTGWRIPMRRKRFYLRARRDAAEIAPVQVNKSRSQGEQFESTGIRLAECIEEKNWDDVSLRVNELEHRKYAGAMNVVEVNDPDAIVACFTSAYGKSPVHAGSYLKSPKGNSLRRFSPQEIGRLMGYREEFWWPEELNQRARYQLLGNALCVTVVRSLLATMLDLH